MKLMEFTHLRLRNKEREEGGRDGVAEVKIHSGHLPGSFPKLCDFAEI